MNRGFAGVLGGGEARDRTLHGSSEGGNELPEVQILQSSEHISFTHGLSLALLASIIRSRRDVGDEYLGAFRNRQ